ncbi:MAG: hypothetical protein ACFFCS_00475 [Candidatus Hodarchaeota archaeon]
MVSEDTIILLAVDREYTHMGAVTKALEDFFQTKSSLDLSDRFNMVLFLENGPAYLEDFTFQWDRLINLLKQNQDTIGKPNLEGGLFLALTFILDIYKIVSGKYFRILVIKDGSVPEMTKDFLVTGLVEKIHPMPVFLDVIVLGMYDDPDKEKLENMIDASKGGDLIYATTFKEFQDALNHDATNKKEIKVGLWEDKPDYHMAHEHKPFFEDLASDLEPITKYELNMKCTVCFQPTSPVCGTDALVKCPSCNTTFHDCCLISWADQSNIGIDHVFRCPICFYLIKLPEFMLDTKVDDFSFESFLEEINQDDLLKEKDAKRELNLILKELEF